jgi:sirohydrochlorin cobaltochelatase
MGKKAFTSFAALMVLLTGCASGPLAQRADPEKFGVVIMAHGGGKEWNQAVTLAAAPLKERYPTELAFGMADAASIQAAVQRLESQGVNRVAVVRLFISGESWKERTEQILGIAPGAPARPRPTAHDHHGMHGHSMEFWKIQTRASFAVSEQGLGEAPEMGAVLADRAVTLSHAPEREDVLILAHGPETDEENARWIEQLQARAVAIKESRPFRRVQVETLREDWPDKRGEAEKRIREYVERAHAEAGTAIVIPFRVQGFGPYAEVLKDLEYASDGVGLLPHPNVSRWLQQQADTLRNGPFRRALPSGSAAQRHDLGGSDT